MSSEPLAARTTADRCNAAMVFKKDWESARPMDLEPWYCHWVGELTAQGLHSKADIATVLAILSKRLASGTTSATRGRSAVDICIKAGESFQAKADEARARDWHSTEREMGLQAATCRWLAEAILAEEITPPDSSVPNK